MRSPCTGLLAVPALPGRIGADRVLQHGAPQAVAADDRGGLAGQRHQGVGEVGVGLAPDEGVHAAHGGPEDQAEMIHPQPLDQQTTLGLDHVRVAVLREAGAQAVRGLRRGAVAQVVRHDDVVAGHIQRLARPEQFAGELGRQELGARAAGAVEQEHGVLDSAVGAATRRAEGAVVNAQLRQRLHGDHDVPGDEVPLRGREGLRDRRKSRQQDRGGT